MTSLFFSFDISNYSGAMLFLHFSIFILLSMSFLYSQFSVVMSLSSSIFIKFFLSLKPLKFNKISVLFFLSFFLLLMIINLFSVFSYNFPLSSQVSLMFMISLSIWVSTTFFGISKNFKMFLSHLIPEGAPIALASALFLIELISSLIRPITLMVRLVANILAGHLLMILLSGLIFSYPLSSFLYLILTVVEIFVSLIQSYIFSTMIVLYFSEV